MLPEVMGVSLMNEFRADHHERRDFQGAVASVLNSQSFIKVRQHRRQ